MIFSQLNKFRSLVLCIFLPLFLINGLIQGIAAEKVLSDNQNPKETLLVEQVVTSVNVCVFPFGEKKIKNQAELARISGLKFEQRLPLVRSAAYSFSIDNESKVNFRFRSFLISHFSTST